MSENSERVKQWQREMKLKGLCTNCGRPRDCASKCKCLKCLEKDRNRHRLAHGPRQSNRGRPCITE